jgi:predicted nucleic acid-binding protein
VIVDASVILAAFFPDEAQAQAQAVIRDHLIGHTPLVAPSLLPYEIMDAVVRAVRRRHISMEQRQDILASFEGLEIALMPVHWPQVVSLARRFGRSAYEAAYLALAEATGEPLITGDARLYHEVHDDLAWVQWLGDYRGTA